MQKKKLTVAIVGNPNCGKTVLFNALTGSHQHVGNWPGVTVEKKTGTLELDDFVIEVVDLPGIYALYANSEDERVALEYLQSREADFVINILDASNLERNLFLTTQLMEMKVPVLLALNMMDIALARGIHLDSKALAKSVGAHLIELSAISSDSFKSFLILFEKWLKKGKIQEPKALEHLPIVESWVSENESVFLPLVEEFQQDTRGLAIQYLEGNVLVGDRVKEARLYDRSKVESFFEEEPEFVIADSRYTSIKKLIDKVVIDRVEKSTATDKIDKVILNRFLGIPIFIFIMYLVFWIAVTVGEAFIDFFEILFGAVFVDGLTIVLEKIGAPGFVVALLADGLGAGVQTVATFVPVIFFMFFTLSFLEDSGYMARAAFVVDRLMRLLGLPGKAFVPMIVGFGCSVPALMATRTMENKRERFLTLFLVPFMSCGARLPVYALFGAAFFGKSAGTMIFLIYMLGIVIAMLYGLLLRFTLFKGDSAPFVMELPAYHLPKLKTLLRHSWYKLRHFVINAGRIVIFMVTILGFMGSIGLDGSFGNTDTKDSVLSAVGKSITPIFEPFGVEEDNWPASVALFTGLFAKEAIIGTLNSLYSMNEGNESDEETFSLWNATKEAFASIPENLKEVPGSIFEPLGVSDAIEEGEGEEYSSMLQNMRSYFSLGKHQVFAYLLFILLYVPCLAALGTAYKELGAYYGTIMTIYQTILGWSISVLYFQIAAGKSVFWISASAIALVLMSASLWFIGKRDTL